MVMLVMLMLVLEMLYILCKCILLFHSGEDSLAVKLIPGSSNYNSAFIIFSDNVKCLFKLCFLRCLCMRENDAGCVLDLIAEELAKVLHIHLAFICINNGGEAVKLCLLAANCGGRLDNVGELSNARWLNNNSIGMIFIQYFAKCLREITNERAADAARVHLGNFNSCISKKSAVNTDLAELIFDKNKLFARISLFNKLLYKCSFTRAKKAGKNIDLCHFYICPERTPF